MILSIRYNNGDMLEIPCFTVEAAETFVRLEEDVADWAIRVEEDDE